MYKHTISHELAKRLKEAGMQSCHSFWSNEHKEMLPDPTLEELIEACGDRFERLELKQSHFGGPHWCVHGKGVNLGGSSTPEIAVAALWLELNKK
jgi:hypothetical protein